MALKGWFLLAVFLLMQAGSSVAGGCGPSAERGIAEGGSRCQAVCGCCAGGSDSAPGCTCTEAPAPVSQESPALPVPTSPGTGRDLLPPPVWIEAVTAGPPAPLEPRAGVAPRPARAFVRLSAPSVGRTVLYCAFLI